MIYLFVCTGNTCRSPMAEGLFNDLAAKKGNGDSASSAGIFAFDGASPSENSVEVMREIGIDISGHTSRRLTAEIIGGCDRLLTMTNSHAEVLKSSLPQYAGIISTLTEEVGESGEIPDPFGGDLEEYRLCRDRIKELIEKLAGGAK